MIEERTGHLVISIQCTVEEGKALHQLISVAERKGRVSGWWRDIAAKVTGKRSGDKPSFHEELGRAVGP